jgi:hypothetical protein
MGAPGLVLTVIVLGMLKEPARGLVEGSGPHDAPAAPFSVVLAHIWRTPALRLVMTGGTLAQFGMTAIAQFMAPLFARTYHLPPAQAATAFGLVSAAALTLGLLLGALGTDKAGQKDLRWSAWRPAVDDMGRWRCDHAGAHCRLPQLLATRRVVGGEAPVRRPATDRSAPSRTAGTSK